MIRKVQVAKPAGAFLGDKGGVPPLSYPTKLISNIIKLHSMNLLIILVLFFSTTSNIAGQINDSTKVKQLSIDTIKYQFDSTGTTIDFWWYNLDEGVNLIVDTASSYKMIGTAKKRFKLGFLLRTGSGEYMVQIGLWTYYCQNRIIGYEAFDNKGRTLGKVEMYGNGQVKTSRYRPSAKQKFEFSESFFEDGSPVRIPDDLEKWIYETKEKNCAQ